MGLRESIIALVAAAPHDAVVPVRWLGELLDAESIGRLNGDDSDATVDLTVAQLAIRFGKGKSTVRTWLERGQFPGAYRLHGREWRIPASAVSAMQRDQAAQHQAAAPVSSRRRPADITEWRNHLPKAS